MFLKNKVSLITGATKGIGKAIAIRFAEEGSKVIFTGRNKSLGIKVTKLIEKSGGSASFFPGDIGVYNDVKAIFKHGKETFGDIEILVNNAGIYESKPFSEITEEQWDKIFQVNLKGVFYTCKEFISTKKGKKKGVILNMTSIAAKTGGIFPVSHYAASKAAIMCLTKSLAREFSQFGVRVNALAPGTIETEMTKSFSKSKIYEIPLSRIGKVSEVAAVAAFICSDEASYITGEIVDVNGGQYMD